MRNAGACAAAGARNAYSVSLRFSDCSFKSPRCPLHTMYYLPHGSGRPTVVTIHDISFELFPQFFSKQSLVKNDYW